MKINPVFCLTILTTLTSPLIIYLLNGGEAKTKNQSRKSIASLRKEEELAIRARKFHSDFEKARSADEKERLLNTTLIDWSEDSSLQAFCLADIAFLRKDYKQVLAIYDKWGTFNPHHFFQLEESLINMKGRVDLQKMRHKALLNPLNTGIREAVPWAMSQYRLDENQAFLFLKGTDENQGRDDAWIELMRTYPSYYDVWVQYESYLVEKGRGKEIVPLAEEWYRRANDKQRQDIRKHFGLDYKRLDNEDKP